MNKVACITGILGQDGSYLAEKLLGQGYAVHGFSRESSDRGDTNISHLREMLDDRLFVHKYRSFAPVDTTLHDCIASVHPSLFFHMGSHPSIGSSFVDPVNVSLGICADTMNLLNTIRTVSPNTRFLNASSAAVFGNQPGLDGFDEHTAFKPESPYAVAKAMTHNMVKIYRDVYGMHASNAILFHHESPRRSADFLSRKIARAVASIRDGLEGGVDVGNMDVFKEWGYAPEHVDAMLAMIRLGEPDDFVVATGECRSIREYIQKMFAAAGLDDYRNYVTESKSFYRPNDIAFMRGKPTKLFLATGWQHKTDLDKLVGIMYEAEGRIEP